MKKAVSALLILALLCTFCCTAMAAGEQRSGNFRYKVLSDGTVEITKYSSYDSEAIIIPETIDGHTVSSIGKNAFMYASITSLTIGSNITNIGDSAFFSCDAETVTINAGDLKIGKQAFSCCSNIKTFSLTANNVEIGNSAFMYTEPLTTFNWQLADANAQGTKTVIGENAFFSSGIVDITIPGDNLQIGKKAFSCCSSIKSMTALCRTITIGDQAFMYAEFESFSLPNAGSVGGGTGKLGDSSFFSCGLKSFVVPASIQKIEAKAFSCCSDLESIVIPPTVTSIGSGAFQLANSSMVAKVVAGSYADQYCKKNRIACEYITDEELTSIYGDSYVGEAESASEAAAQQAAALPKNTTPAELHFTNYTYKSDKWDLYKATFLSASTLKIEKWTRWNAGEDGDPFKYSSDICVINITDGSTDFAWADSTQTAFTITLTDDRNSHLDDSARAAFTVSSSEIDSVTEYTYMNDKWNWYRAYALSDSVIKIEKWSRFNAGEDGDPFAYESDIRIIQIANDPGDFAWTDDSHLAFTITMQDEDNGYWEEARLTPFAVDVDPESTPFYSYQNDKWNWYKAYKISDTTLRVERWSRFNAGEDGDPFKRERDICIIKTEENANGFAWSDETHSAFTITMIDEDNGYWEEAIAAPFAIESSEPNQRTLTYLNDRWDLYVATVLSDESIIIENWSRFNAGEDGDPFKREYHVMVINTADGSTDFKWTDDSHVAFTITMADAKNSYWDETKQVTFTLDETLVRPTVKVLTVMPVATPEPAQAATATATPAPTSTPKPTAKPTVVSTEVPTEEPVAEERANDAAASEEVEQILDLSGYNDAELLTIYAQVRNEIFNRRIEKTATVTPGKYLVGRDLPAGQYVLNNTSGETVYIAVFKDNAKSYKDSEAVERFNFYADRETTITLEEGQVFEVRHHRIEITVSSGIVFK